MNNVTSISQRLAVARKQAASFPTGTGVCIAGSSKNGLYKVAQSGDISWWLKCLQSRTGFPLEIAAWMPGNYEDSRQQANRLRYIFRANRRDDGWLGLSGADLAEARAYLDDEKERIASEAAWSGRERAMALEQAAGIRQEAFDGCVRLIVRLRDLEGIVSRFVDHCRSGVKEYQFFTSDKPQSTAGKLRKTIDQFQEAIAKLDQGISPAVMEVKLALSTDRNGRRPK